MINKQISKKKITPLKKDEKILVVKRSDFFLEKPWQGLKEVNFEKYLQQIQEKKEFLWRSEMELDPSYKQIIPYLIFEHENNYFLMQRRSKASETRLANKYTFGIGGHIREEDIQGETLFDWAKREFHEEVNYNGNLQIKPLGIINDDSTQVGKVHVGFVLLLKGNSDKISIKSELKNGQLLSLNTCKQYYNCMESWSKIIFDNLTII